MRGKGGFLGNAVVFGIGGAATRVVSAILLPLYTHYLTPAEYGVLELLERTGAIVILLLLGNGIRMATFSFYCQAKTPHERQRTFSSIALVVWTILLIGALAGWLLAPWLAGWLAIADSRLVAFGIAVVMLESYLTFPMALLQARVESVSYVTANLLIAATRMTLIIAGVVWFGLGVWGVLLASAVTSAVLGSALTRRELAAGFPPPNLDVAKQVIQFALPLLPTGLMGLALAGADRYFLVTYAGAAEVGIYALGARLATVIPGAAIGPLWKVWTAALYDYYRAPDATVRVGRVILRILFVQIFLALGVSMFSEELVALFAPAAYASAVAVIPLMALAGTLQVANNLFEGAFWSQRKTRWKPVLMACSATVAVVAFLLFVPRWGSFGAAAALALAYATHASLTFVVTQRIFPVYYDWRTVLIGASLAAILFGASWPVGGSYVALPLKATLWLAWPMLLWLLGIVSDEEQQWCLRQVTRGRRLVGKWLFAATP